MRCMMSKASAQFLAQNVSAIMPVYGGSEGVELSSALQSALDAAETAGDGLFDYRWKDWYTPMGDGTRDNMGELLTNRITPEEFVANVQAIADEVKADEDIPKYTRT